MTQKERALVAFLLAWGIFFMNLAGGYFSWYSSIWWYDMLMHFSGGVMIGTTALLFAFSLKTNIFGTIAKPKYARIIACIGFGVIFWEALEFSLSNAGGIEFHMLDSLSDMLIGMAGALFVLSKSTVIE